MVVSDLSVAASVLAAVPRKAVLVKDMNNSFTLVSLQRRNESSVRRVWVSTVSYSFPSVPLRKALFVSRLGSGCLFGWTLLVYVTCTLRFLI